MKTKLRQVAITLLFTAAAVGAIALGFLSHNVLAKDDASAAADTPAADAPAASQPDGTGSGCGFACAGCTLCALGRNDAAAPAAVILPGAANTEA